MTSECAERNPYGNDKSIAGFGCNPEAIAGDNQPSRLRRREKLTPMERGALVLFGALLIYALVRPGILSAQDHTSSIESQTTREPCPPDLSDYTHIPAFGDAYMSPDRKSFTWVRGQLDYSNLLEVPTPLQMAEVAEEKPICQNTPVYDLYGDNDGWFNTNSSWEPRVFKEERTDLNTGEKIPVYNTLDVDFPHQDLGLVYIGSLNALTPEYNPGLQVTENIQGVPYVNGAVTTDPNCLLDPTLPTDMNVIAGLEIVTQQLSDGTHQSVALNPLTNSCEKLPKVSHDSGSQYFGNWDSYWQELAEAALSSCPNLPPKFTGTNVAYNSGDGIPSVSAPDGSYAYVLPESNLCDIYVRDNQ